MFRFIKRFYEHLRTSLSRGEGVDIENQNNNVLSKRSENIARSSKSTIVKSSIPERKTKAKANLNFDKKPIKAEIPDSEKPTNPAVILNTAKLPSQESINQTLDLVIGFDLGTSTCKVVVQAPDLPESPAWVVNFNEFGYGPNSSLLPTVIYFNKADRRITLAQESGSIEYRNVKVGLFAGQEYCQSLTTIPRESVESSRIIFATSFMGLTLRYITDFVSAMNLIPTSINKINWHLNLGIPSPTLGQFIERERFEIIAYVGWKLSREHKDSMEVKHVKSEIKKFKKNKEDYIANPSVEINLIPEIVAGAYGYALSPQRRNGLHIMVDIGASTVDVCGFRLNRHFDTLENVNALLEAEVKPLGTFRIHNLNGESNYLIPIEDTKFTDAELREVGNEFKELIRLIITRIKRSRDPLAEEFQPDRKLPIIVIGGGSISNIYIRWIKDIDVWITHHHIRNGGLEFINVPIEEVVNINSAEYFTVAWGLSHQAINIGQLILPSEIADTSGQEFIAIKDAVTKDQT